jgi:trimeric autotransporter adhesin
MHASMNRSFKVVYNVALGAYVAVSEITRGRGKSTKSVVALAVAVLLSGGAYAGPLGGNVVGGQATIQNSGALTTINQATNRAIINWNGFNVNKNETVQFNQPNINAVTLNRVLSASPSLIDGAIKANGNVFIVNAAGIVVGKNANINVGGLTLSTLGISNEDFMAGRDKFVNSTGTNAQVLNQGNIEVAQGGFVAMIGGQVSNTGVIVAKEGMVALASGNAVTLTIGDGPTAHSIVVEQGTVDALVEAGGAVRVDGGQIVLAARSVNGLLKNIINQTGVLEANSVTRKGGKIILDGGDQGIVNIAGTIKADGQTGGSVVATGHDVLLTGQISATGKSDGGQVNIGGGYQGQDPTIAHATNVAMTKSASIDVSSTDNGKGGTAVLWSDGTTDFYGDIKAKAGVNGGDGGLIETSGHNLGFNGTVDVNAPKGTSGNILLDPDMIVITSAATGAQDATLPTITGTAADAKGTKSTVSVNAIEAITSGTVSLKANGYIQVQDLTLNGGDGEINMKPNVSLNLSTISDTGSYTGLPSLPGYGGIEFTNSANGITATGTGSVTLSAGNFTAPQTTAVTANAQAINIGHIQTEAGAITLRGADGLQVKGNLTTNSGAIFLDGDADQGGVGFLNVTSNFKTNSGLVTLKGGQDSSSGVNIIGNVDVGSGGLTFANTGTTFAGTYRIAGNVSALNNFTIAQPVTLGGTATIKTTGQLGFVGIVTVEANSNLTLTATSYSIANAINGNGSSITLKPANVTDDLQLGTGGTGTNVAPVLTKLNNFGNVTIGGSDLQGKVTVSGTNNIVGKLTIAAGGTGGTVVMQNGTNLTTNKDIIVTADKSITAEGTALLTSTGGKVSLVTPGDLTLTAGSKLKATTFVEIATDGKFTNPAGLGLVDPATPYWRLYVPNADSLVGTGFSASTGFHRYGCTLAGCASTTSVPGTGNGILFKDVPLLDINAISGSFVYGNALTTFGTTVNYAGLINGDTIVDAGITGTAGNAAYSTTPSFSSAGYVNAGAYGINATTGSLLSSMGYKFKEVANSGTATVTKRTVGGTVTAQNKTYDGTTAASLTGLSGLLGDNVSVTSAATFADKNAGANKVVNGSYSIGGTDGGNYQVDASGASSKAITTTATINKANVIASFTALGKEYDGTIASGVSNLAVTGLAVPDTINNTVTYNMTNVNFGDKNAGVNKTVTGTFVLGGADAGNYNVTNSNLTSSATITKKNLTAIANANTKTYDATTSATLLNSNLFGIVTNDNVTYSITGLAFGDKNAGIAKSVTGTVNLGGTDSANYTVGTSTGAGNIDRRALTGSATIGSKVYDGTTTATIVGASLSGVIAGDSAVLSLASSNAAFADKNAGTGKAATATIGINGTDAGNYYVGNASNQIATTGTIVAKTITSNITAANKTYDGTTAATLTGGNLTGVIAADVSTVNLSVGAATFADKNAGANKTVTAASSISGSNASNYTLSNPSTTTTATINKKDVTATFQANTKTYDGTTAATLLGSSVTGFIANDVVTSSVSGIAFADKNAGVNKTVNGTVNLAGNDAGNYNVATSTGTGTIDKKALNSSLTANKTYDGTTVATVSGSFGGGTIGGEIANASIISTNFSDKNVANNKTVTTSFNITGADAANYYIGNTSNQLLSTANITPLAISSNIVAADKTYDTTRNATITSSNLVGVLAADTSTVNLSVGAALFSDKNAAANKTVTATSALSGTDAGNYTLSNPTTTTTATINKKDVNGVITVNDKIYDGNTVATLTSGTVNGVFTNDASRVTLNVGPARFSDKNAANGKTVTANTSISGLEAGNYNLVNPNTSTTANIAKKDVTAGVNAFNKTYDGNNTATISGTSLTGLIAADSTNVNLAVGVANFSDKNAANGKTVTANLSLSGSEAGNYNLTNATTTTIANITKKDVTSSFVVSDKEYDATTNATLVSAALAGVLAADAANVTDNIANVKFVDKNAGTGKTVTGISSLSGSEAGNYNVVNSLTTSTANISKKNISANIVAANKTYDGTTAASIISTNLTGVIATDSLNVIAAAFNPNFADKNAANGKTVTANVGLAGAESGNYNLTNPNTSATANIAKKTLTNAGITASNKTYDGNNTASATANNLTGIITNDNLTTSVAATFSDKNAANGKTVTGTTTLGGTDAGNYTLNSATSTTTANIDKKAITATVNASTKEYDATTNVIGSTGTLNGVIGTDAVGFNSNNVKFVDKNAGVNKAVVSDVTLTNGADVGNYTLAAQSTGTGTITPKNVTGTVSANNKTYDGTTNATGTGVVSGLITGDAVTTTLVNGQFSDKNAGIGKTVTGTIGLSGNDETNYNLTTTTATGIANIDKKAVVASLATVSKTYDGTDTANSTAGFTDFIVNDDVNVAATNAKYSDKNAGTGKTVTANVALSGNDANNYSITAVANGTGDITKKSISGDITASNKTYDGTTAATVTGSTTGKVLNDSLDITTSNANFIDKNAGNGKAVTANVGLSGNDANNYVLSNATASTTADIGKKTITNAGITASNKTYDGNTTATATANTFTDAIANDIVNGTVTANFSDKNAGAGKTVTGVTTLTGNDANNYVLNNNTATTTANIDKKVINNTGIVASNKTYDGSTLASATGNTLTDKITGDDLSSTVVANFSDKNAGTGKTVTGVSTLTGNDAGNYALNSATSTTTADIAKKVITNNGIVASNKTYDGNTTATATGAALTDLVANDDVNITVTNANFSDKNAGVGKTVTATTNLTGNDAGNYVFNSATSTTTANIDKKIITATGATANDKTYDATTNATANAGTLNGLVGTDIVTASVTNAQFLDKNAGSNKTVNITTAIGGNDASNYALDTNLSTATANIAQKTITNNGITSTGKTYDGNTQVNATANTLTDIINGDFVSASVAAQFGDKNAGTGKTVTGVTTLGGNDGANYKFANDTSTTTADIAKKVITNNGITAINKTYDGTTAAQVAGAGLTDLVATDDVQISISNANFSDKNAGVGKTVTATTNLTGTDASNYVFNSATSTTTANIDKKTLTVNGTTAANKTYDATTSATATVGTVAGLVGTDVVTASITDAQFTDKNAGVGKTVNVTTALGGADVGNYQLGSAASTTTANIDKKVIANNGIVAGNKTYDGTTVANATANGLTDIIGTDQVQTSVAANFADKNAGNGKVVTGVTTLTGTDAGNYAFNNDTSISNADIAKKVITNNGITASNKTYDGTTTAQVAGAGLTDLVATDDVQISVTNANFSDKNAGVGKTVTATTNLTGTDASNYVFNSATSTTTANIDKRAISATGTTVDNKTYDGTTAAQVNGTKLVNTVQNDDIKVGATGNFDNKNAGLQKDVNIAYALSGADANNYVLDNSSAQAKADVAKKVLTYTVDANGQKTYFLGETQMPVGFNPTLANKIAGDDVNVQGLTFVSNGQAVVPATTGGFTVGITIGGKDVGNYEVDYSNSSANVPVQVVNKPVTPVTRVNPATSNVISQRAAAVSDFVQQINYVPVYANGRGIDSKAKITAVTPEDNEADTLKGNRAGAVGTRSEPELQSTLIFKDPAKIKEVDDEMKK